jgi:hypothetical protein
VEFLELDLIKSIEANNVDDNNIVVDAEEANHQEGEAEGNDD